MQQTIFGLKFEIKDPTILEYPGSSNFFSIEAGWKSILIRDMFCDFSFSSSIRFRDDGDIKYSDIYDYCEKNSLSCSYLSFTSGIYGYKNIFNFENEDGASILLPEYIFTDSKYNGMASLRWFVGGILYKTTSEYIVETEIRPNLISIDLYMTVFISGNKYYSSISWDTDSFHETLGEDCLYLFSGDDSSKELLPLESKTICKSRFFRIIENDSFSRISDDFRVERVFYLGPVYGVIVGEFLDFSTEYSSLYIENFVNLDVVIIEQTPVDLEDILFGIIMEIDEIYIDVDKYISKQQRFQYDKGN